MSSNSAHNPWPDWKVDSVGFRLESELVKHGFESICDSDGITMVRKDKISGLTLSVSRRDDDHINAPSRVAWKYVKSDDKFRKIVPSACDMSSKIWWQLTKTQFSNSDVLFFSSED